MRQPMSRRLLAAFVLMVSLGPVHGQPALFKDADYALGEKLIVAHRCAECHARRLGGDGTAIYRPLGRINTPGFLRGMVRCLTGTLLQVGTGVWESDRVAALLAARNRALAPPPAPACGLCLMQVDYE